MAAHFGVVNTFGLTAPTVGYINEASQDQAQDLALVKDEDGVVVKAVPKLLITSSVTISGKGDAQFAGVVAGAFAADTVKILKAKQDESWDEMPDFEISGKAYSTAT